MAGSALSVHGEIARRGAISPDPEPDRAQAAGAAAQIRGAAAIPVNALVDSAASEVDPQKGAIQERLLVHGPRGLHQAMDCLGVPGVDIPASTMAIAPVGRVGGIASVPGLAGTSRQTSASLALGISRIRNTLIISNTFP